jgi:hypothetical protein
MMNTEMNTLLEAIKADYASLNSGDKYTEIRAKMVEEFNEKIGYTEGKKYIKVFTGYSKSCRMVYSYSELCSGQRS